MLKNYTLLILVCFALICCNEKKHTNSVEMNRQKNIAVSQPEQKVIELLENSSEINEKSSENDRNNRDEIIDLIISKTDYALITYQVRKKEDHYISISVDITTNKFHMYVFDKETLLIEEDYTVNASFKDKLEVATNSDF